jgi:hypothetical protein
MFEVSANGVTIDSRISYQEALGIYNKLGSSRKRIYQYLDSGSKVVVVSTQAVFL